MQVRGSRRLEVACGACRERHPSADRMTVRTDLSNPNAGRVLRVPEEPDRLACVVRAVVRRSPEVDVVTRLKGKRTDAVPRGVDDVVVDDGGAVHVIAGDLLR